MVAADATSLAVPAGTAALVPGVLPYLPGNYCRGNSRRRIQAVIFAYEAGVIWSARRTNSATQKRTICALS
jgi:hypothetical protein